MSRSVVMSVIGKKIANMPLGTPESPKGMAKLGLAIALLTIAVKWARYKKYLPVDLHKSA